MLDAWGDHPVVAQTLAEASDALGEDLGLLIRQGPKETLALTTNTQPVMLVAAVAAYRVWMQETGQAPAAVAGHSLGEYSAMVAAGVRSDLLIIPGVDHSFIGKTADDTRSASRLALARTIDFIDSVIGDR